MAIRYTNPMLRESLFKKIDNKFFVSALVIFIVAVATFGNGLTNGFLLDDYNLIVNNYELHHPQNLNFAYKNFLGVYFRPITSLSFALDFSLWQYRPFGYHLTNILLHAINALLLMCLIRLLTQCQGTAFLSALFLPYTPYITFQSITSLTEVTC